MIQEIDFADQRRAAGSRARDEAGAGLGGAGVAGRGDGGAMERGGTWRFGGRSRLGLGPIHGMTEPAVPGGSGDPGDGAAAGRGEAAAFGDLGVRGAAFGEAAAFAFAGRGDCGFGAFGIFELQSSTQSAFRMTLSGIATSCRAARERSCGIVIAS